jgi:hypothetical protein
MRSGLETNNVADNEHDSFSLRLVRRALHGSVAIIIESVYYCARFYVSEFAARKPPLFLS